MITENEKKYLKLLVERDLKNLKKAESTIIQEISPAFLKGESEYEDFINNIIKKLK